MKKFIGEEISVFLPDGDFLEKNPKCPLSFTWQNQEISVVELLQSWTDFSRKGNRSRNMRTEHLQRAKLKGSWGVGRFYFTVKGETGRIFTIYYDRSPSSSSHRKGKWFLFVVE